MQIMQFIQDSPEVWIPLAIILGLAIGSFLNVAIYRLPIMLFRIAPTVPSLPSRTSTSTGGCG